MRVRRDKSDVLVVVGRAAGGTEAVEVLLDVAVAEEADLIAALARTEVAFRGIQVLHAQRTACAAGECHRHEQSVRRPRQKGARAA